MTTLDKCLSYPARFPVYPRFSSETSSISGSNVAASIFSEDSPRRDFAKSLVDAATAIDYSTFTEFIHSEYDVVETTIVNEAKY